MIHVKAKASPREIYTKWRKWRAKTLCKHYFYTIHHKKVGNYFAKSLTHKSRIIPFAIAEVVYLASKPHYTWNIYRKMKSNQSPHNRTAMNPLKGLTIRTISGLFLSPAKRGVANRDYHTGAFSQNFLYPSSNLGCARKFDDRTTTLTFSNAVALLVLRTH